MVSRYFTWKLVMSVIAVLIVILTFFYSNRIVKKISIQERKKVEEWVAAQELIASASFEEDISLASIIVSGQQSIPVIETNERDSIMNYLNLDSSQVNLNKSYLINELNEFKKRGAFITTYFDASGKKYNRYYYGESTLLKQVRYFPLVQLLVVILFSIFMLVSIRNRYKSAQNQLWAGLAKETAHQLGTPISALSGWLEILKENDDSNQVVSEMQKDVERLKLISDRFSMIGGRPKKEPRDIIQLVSNVVEYMKKRASEKTNMIFMHEEKSPIMVNLSAQLIEWVFENLIKNALDSMEGRGTLTINISEDTDDVHIDFSDTGKGLSKSLFNQVFNPGYTTRKRGWGVGLTLSKRIVEQYHGGQIFVKNAEIGKGTTFSVILKK